MKLILCGLPGAAGVIRKQSQIPILWRRKVKKDTVGGLLNAGTVGNTILIGDLPVNAIIADKY